MRKIIDVSEFNGVIDWAAAASHIDGAILRAGYRGYGSGSLVRDARAAENLRNAQAAGVPVGLYVFTQAVTEAEAAEEADFCVRLLNGAAALPICWDTEPANGGAGRGDRIDRALRTRCAQAFADRVRALGYTPALYCSNGWYQSHVDGTALRAGGMLAWIASHPACRGAAYVEPKHPWDGWQFSPYETVPGIGTETDMSWFAEPDGDGFADVAGHWAEAAIARVRAAGLMNGRTAAAFAPDAPITRAETATALSRLLDRIGI